MIRSPSSNPARQERTIGFFSNQLVIIGSTGRILRSLIRSRMLWGLLIIDAAFLALHLAVTGFSLIDTAPSTANWARVDRDGSVSEVWELILLSSAALALIMLAKINRRIVTVPLAAILAFLAADNFLRFHERFAGVLLPGRQDSGELLFFVLVLFASAALTVWSWYGATSRERSFIVAIWCGIMLLGAFGAGVDAIHAIASRWFVQAERTVGIVEDFGELVSISIIAALSWVFMREALASGRERLSPASARREGGGLTTCGGES